MTIYHWLFAITLSLVSSNTYSCPQNILSNSKFVASIHKQNEQMPNFKFYDLNGQLFTPQQLSYKNYLTFIFYDVDCDHCQEQAAAIAKNIKHFKKTTLLWVTIGEDSKIEAFKQKYFKNTKNVIFLNDRDMNIFEAFNGTITDTPTTLIFDKNRREITRMYKAKVDKIYGFYK